eukprot:EC851013.1.p1 GENE.EC851013.1~~EC851013.1.p1  ORF type:complete len:132 (+),score=44.23 EC851013.1:28-396(+)
MKGGLVFVLLLLVAAASSVAFAGKRSVMPWNCLERCGSSTDVAQMTGHASTLNVISYEAFDLGKNSTLVDLHFSKLQNILRNVKYEGGLYPMITTVDIHAIEQVMSNPEPFITAAVKSRCGR